MKKDYDRIMELKIIAVRVTGAEHSALMVAGAKAGLRLSSYMRKLAGLKPLQPGGAQPGAGRPKKKEVKK